MRIKPTFCFFHPPAGHGFLGSLGRRAAAAAPGTAPRGEGGNPGGGGGEKNPMNLWEDLGIPIGKTQKYMGRSKDLWKIYGNI